MTIEAAYSKHRREDVLPVHPDLAARLRQWLSEREQQADGESVILTFNHAAGTKCGRLFPGKWAERAAAMLRTDLDAAGIP